MDSSASVLATPAQSERLLKPFRPRFRLSGGSVALTFSIACHLGLALLATRHFRTTAIAPELDTSTIELLAADFEVLAETEESPSPRARRVLPTPVPHPTVKNSVVRDAAPAAPRLARPDTAGAEPKPEPVAVSTAPDSGLLFKLTVAKIDGGGDPKLMAVPAAAPAAGSSTSQPLSSASVDTQAQLRSGNVPAYTAAALAAGIEATVPLEIVISESGVVSSVRGLEHVGYGLDEAARQSVLGYRFTPASRSGRAVAVRMRWLMRFQLR